MPRPDVPHSARSREVVREATPVLQSRLGRMGLELGAPVFVRVFKATNELELWVRSGEEYHLFQTYDICYYSGELGPKLRTGDKQSPEGFYYVSPERMNPYSRYHLSFNLGYPNSFDQYHQRTGSALMIHGNCVSIGCYAMGDQAIEEIYTLASAALEKGQPYFRVHVFPFRLTAKNMDAHKSSKWIEFWKNLKVGYDWFEKYKIPPNVLARDGFYTFASTK